jgi:hypothetical protein
MRAVKLKTAILLAGYLLVIGCTSTPETPTPTSTPEPASLVSTASPAASKTPIPTPQPTVTPAETPYPTPEAPLDADGPWLIFLAALTDPDEEYVPPYLWAMNADGTGLTLLDQEPVQRYSLTLRPDNTQDSRSTLVYITDTSDDYLDLTLKSITLPDLEKTIITPLVGSNKGDFNGDPLVALENGWYLWSSDGNTLVFVGLMDRQYSDIYTYDFTTKAITRLTGDDYLDYDESNEDGFWGDQGNACCFRWSPDERYVIYTTFGIGTCCGALGGAPWQPGLAAARVGGGRDFTMINMGAHFKVFGWHSPNEILLYDGGLADWDPASGIYAFNLDTGETTTIIDEVVSNVAYAEEYDTWLYTLGEDQPLILYKDVITNVLYNPGIDSYDYLRWSDEDNAFKGGGYLITLDGRVSQTIRTQTPNPPSWMSKFKPRYRESPDGTLWAWSELCYPFIVRYRDPLCGLWVGEPNSEPSDVYTSPQENRGEVDHILLRDFTWSPDSQRLIYITEQGLFMAERPDFEPVFIAQIYGYERFWFWHPMIWAGK